MSSVLWPQAFVLLFVLSGICFPKCMFSSLITRVSAPISSQRGLTWPASAGTAPTFLLPAPFTLPEPFVAPDIYWLSSPHPHSPSGIHLLEDRDSFSLLPSVSRIVPAHGSQWIAVSWMNGAICCKEEDRIEESLWSRCVTHHHSASLFLSAPATSCFPLY